ncbi:MAG TPA: bifunctional [glutamine synthetase] adenylyltransferase/[glutamine synthetase]-adenylyl-L-tyrosine phosphorylase, partial [Hyphomicrobiaceae bacterium]|nr:bifunctional [glutamine synthetase] adenylyltransferase/[glutamine synthetase]-adenylyl-L-tyrosine phosphorylase [Hyphomicrobiaceae bacterium]
WTDERPGSPGGGYIVLGMGKYGAFELNYSSDVDLIVFYEIDRIALRPGVEPQSFFVRLTRELIRILQEPTAEGYVFRTDLRLRPDPGATQIALSYDAALQYYESFGQNWERAALIKARPVAGDLAAGQAFLSELSPFIWRKYLDYAAIADIHAMKRQIHAYRGFGVIKVRGHNIKVGRGGIREIEFFAQTQQLIAGGRQPDLRCARTLDALKRLAQRGWIKAEVEQELAEAYQFLRSIEHRLQMVADEQTHELPESAEALERFARFCGYRDEAELARALTARLEAVQRHYSVLFEDMPELTRDGANMVFAGAVDDPATVEALTGLGYSQPSHVIATVRGWHHGRYPAVRSARARELLTEVQPLLIEALAKTANPDAAFAGFDRFLAELPSGVQLFSLLRANPNLLRLVADIMGTAPRLASILSRRRRVLDAVIDPRVIGTLPSQAEVATLIAGELADAADFQEALDRARVVGNEQAFLIGVRVLSGMIGANQAGGAYALLAEELIAAMQRLVEQDLERAHGRPPGAGAAVIAMGKLGGCEMTAASDLDLIIVYDGGAGDGQSAGPKPLPVVQYYARFTQRLISALSAPTAEGRLYDVDLRLRPSGQKGPVTTQLASFIDYQAKEAWTWEHMALTRARVITGSRKLRASVEQAVRTALLKPREAARIAADVLDMRRRIAAEKGTDNMWDLKQVRGGLVDIEFIAQYLQLIHAARHPDVLDQNTARALQKLAAAGLLRPAHAAVLIPAVRLLHDLTQVLRLCLDGPFAPESAPDGLKALLVRVAEAPSFANLEANLKTVLADSAAAFDEIIGAALR